MDWTLKEVDNNQNDDWKQAMQLIKEEIWIIHEDVG